MTQTMAGKRVLITGGTDGIGKEAAIELAGMGAEVVLVGRDAEKAKAAVEAVNAHSQSASVSYLLADLSSMADVRHLAEAYKAQYDRLDVLVNNAGGAFMKRALTVDGYEKTFALNHLAYFLLTDLLLDTLKASAPARVVNVSSGSHLSGVIDFDDLDMQKGYFVLKAYRQSKLANVMFTYALARRLEGSGVTANVLHPGLVKTGIFRKLRWIGPAVDRVMRTRSRAIEVPQGAETIVYLVSSPEVAGVSGQYFYKCRVTRSSELSHDVEVQERLWQVSAERVGVEG